jgi:transcriptional regulator with XRE-family HTH domain
MAGKSFKELFRQARERDEYWVADAVLSFTEDLHQLAEKKGMSRADLARALKVSTAYVAKVFRGDANFTIETMVKLARAVGARVNIHISPEDVTGQWVDVCSYSMSSDSFFVNAKSVLISPAEDKFPFFSRNYSLHADRIGGTELGGKSNGTPLNS